jgi:hypothetical protein
MRGGAARARSAAPRLHTAFVQRRKFLHPLAALHTAVTMRRRLSCEEWKQSPGAIAATAAPGAALHTSAENG